MKRIVFSLVLPVLAVVATVAAGAAWFVLNPSLPDPAVANREQLVRWLVVRDLGQETLELRATLARRLDEEFLEGPNWQAASGRLNDAQRQRVLDNIPLVIEPWFLEKARGFAATAGHERRRYVDRFLDTMLKWRGADALKTDGPSSPGITARILGQIEVWRERAEREDRARIDEFLVAVQSRWLVRQFSDVLPGLGG